MQTRNFSRSWDHVNWWDPEHWKSRGPRSVSSVSLEGVDPTDIRNGWLTLPESKARFQQKQMQERELKIASLYEAQQARALGRVRHSPSSNGSNGAPVVGSTSPPPQTVPHQPGKVRQMFEERRTKGIDKSYPLQPIHNTERAAPRKALPNGYAKVSTSTTSSRVSVEKKSTRIHTSTSSLSIKKHQHKTDNMVNGSGDLNHNHEPDLNSVKNGVPTSNGEIISTLDELDAAENNYRLEDETFPEALAPIPTPRTPEPQLETKKQPPKRTPVTNKTSPVKAKPLPTASVPPRRITSDNSVSENSKARGAMQRTSNTVPKRHTPASPSVSAGSGKSRPGTAASGGTGAGSAGAGDACAICGRRFATDRLAKHQDICAKSRAKKRKPFDALKHRLAGTDAQNYKGTEAEPFISKLRKGTTPTSSTKVVSKSLNNNNWRQKHEEFIQAIRAAKQVKAHLKAGGKLSDLPPPPPSENPDYVQCPHCSRRFNQGAAERHIPKCANFQFNKPKPKPNAGKRR